MSFRPAVCPACQRNIQIPSDIQNPSCPYCGAVVSQGSPAATVGVATLMGLAQSAALAGNNSEALTYFNRVLEADPRNVDAWIGKGKAAGWQTTLANFRVGEMLVAFNHAIANSDSDSKGDIIRSAVQDANQLVVTIYNMARNHMLEYVSLQNSWPEYVGQMGAMLDALETIHSWLPSNRVTLENIVHICKDNIEGVSYRDQFDSNAPKAWTLNPQYESTLKFKLNDAADKLRSIDPSYTPPEIEKKKAADCFVITAAMDNPLHPDVIYLQRFRDDWLCRRAWGWVLIRTYYGIGPTWATFIAKSDLRRKLARHLIVQPAVWLAARLSSNG